MNPRNSYVVFLGQSSHACGYCSISFNSTGPVKHDTVVEILISATFGIHRDISFFFDQKPERNFFGEQCYCSCTSPVNKDIEWMCNTLSVC